MPDTPAIDILKPTRPIITARPSAWQDDLTCPKCGQTGNYEANGKTRYRKQRYRCLNCNRSFTGGKTGRPNTES